MEGELIELKGNVMVISPHLNDLDDFKALLPKIISSFQKKQCKYYNISVEHPDTNWHLDIVYFITSERKNFDRTIKVILDDFESHHTSTKYPGFVKAEHIKNKVHDIKYRIGYNLKEEPEDSWGNFPEEWKEQCYKYWEENDKSKKSKKCRFPVIAPKASSILEEILSYKHNNPEVAYHDLYNHMVTHGNYSFCCLSDKVQKKALIEAKKRNKVTLYPSEHHAFEYMNGLDNNMQFEGECEKKLNRIQQLLESDYHNKYELIHELF